MKTLSGKELAGFVKARQETQVQSLKKQPTLLIIRDSDNAVIEKYVKLKMHYGEDIGIKVIDYRAHNTSDIKDKIVSANDDSDIDAIILQLPIIEKEKTDELTNLIKPEKDVDGLGENSLYDSATATAILWLLTGYDIKLDNQTIALVGRGKLVGAPLYKMLINSNHHVTMFHRGDDLNQLSNFDIIITATGVPGLITDQMVKPGATIIDAGTASENGILKGDVADSVRNRKDLTAITPIIGGVGPLTVACLFDHVIRSAK